MSKKGRGGRRKLPSVFTEHGAIMAANVLNSGQAIQATVYVVRAFVRLRQIVQSNTDMAEKLAELERKVSGHDEAIRSLVRTIRELMTPPAPERRRIGFRVEKGGPIYGKVRRVRAKAAR